MYPEYLCVSYDSDNYHFSLSFLLPERLRNDLGGSEVLLFFRIHKYSVHSVL